MRKGLAWRWRRRIGRDDGGQLMLLAGIVVTLGFILTSLTLAQVSSLERQALSQQRTGLAEEWRFLHDRISTNLNVAVSPDLANSTFENVTFPTIVATFRSIEAEKGYDTVIRLAGKNATVNKTEVDLVSSATGRYDAWDIGGLHRFDDPYDGGNDGIIWERTCPDADGGSGGCITGVLLFVHLTDGTTSMEEVILFHVNRDHS